MENKTIPTKEEKVTSPEKQNAAAVSATKPVSGVFLTHADAEEYRTYKKRKKLGEVTSAIARSEGTLMGGEDVQRACERAIRLRQAAVKLPLSKLSQAAAYLAGSGVKLDCVVGGTGETLVKVKAFEAREAVKRNAKEVTLVLTHSHLDCCRYGEIRREIKKVRRAAKRADLKVCVQKSFSPTVLARVARLCSEARVKYLSVPNFAGCERVRMDLTGGCALEVVGVETGAEFRKLVEAGVARIVTDRAWEIYADWLREANERAVLQTVETLPSAQNTQNVATGDEKDKTTQSPAKQGDNEKQESTVKPVIPLLPRPQEEKRFSPSEMDYRCRLEGAQLKFL